MRLTLTLMFALLSLNAFALISDRSIELSRVLAENKVPAYGKRKVQGATAYCEISKRSKIGELECQIIVEGPGFEPNAVYETLRGERAQELSNLLIQFDVRPSGRKAVQRADITCRLPKNKLDQPPVCAVLDMSEFIRF